MGVVHSKQVATESRVHEICERLFREGESITARAVQEQLGGGTKPVVYRFIRLWEAKHRERYLMMESALEMDGAAMQAVAAVWEAAARSKTTAARSKRGRTARSKQ